MLPEESPVLLVDAPPEKEPDRETPPMRSCVPPSSLIPLSLLHEEKRHETKQKARTAGFITTLLQNKECICNVDVVLPLLIFIFLFHFKN